MLVKTTSSDPVPARLIPCTDCGADISTRAHACPRCGAPMSAVTVERTSKQIKAVMLTSGVIAASFGAYGFSQSSQIAIVVSTGAGCVFVYARIAAWWRHG